MDLYRKGFGVDMAHLITNSKCMAAEISMLVRSLAH